MVFFIDFDDTIFNTGEFKKELIEIFLRNGISKNEFNSTFLDYPSSSKLVKKSCQLRIYDFNEQIKKLRKCKGNKFNFINLEKEVEVFLKNLKRFVFVDFLKVIKKIVFKKEVFLVSFGSSDFQEKKIKGSGILDFIEDFSISNESKGLTIKKLIKKRKIKTKKNVFFFIDDRPDQIKAVADVFPDFYFIRLRRKEGRYFQLDNLKLFSKLKFFEAKDFFEVFSILKLIEKNKGV